MILSRLGPAARCSRVVNCKGLLRPSHQPSRTSSRVLPGLTIRWVSSRCHYRSFALSRGSAPTRLPQTHGQVRGKKTKTVVSLDDLPQGVIRADPVPPTLEEEPPPTPAYPTVVLQARRNMQKFDNCVLLTRVGGFYELYFEHADEYGPLLNLKVAQKKTAAGLVPMVNFSLVQTPHLVSSSSPPCYHTFLFLSWHVVLVFLTLLFPLRVTGRLSVLPARPVPQDLGPRPESVCCYRGRISEQCPGEGQVGWFDA